MSATPYTNIGDANMEAAFLANSDGYDVATLMRVIKIDVSPTHQTLNDEQWQQMIDLIDAAPDLLAALERLAHPMADDEDLDYAREVIAKAKGQQ